MTPDPLSPVGLAVRALLLSGILAATGAAIFRLFVIPALARKPDENAGGTAVRVAVRAAGIGFLGTVLVLAGAALRLWLQAREFSDPLAGTGVDYSMLLLRTTWGRAWLVQVAATIVAMAAYRRCMAGNHGWKTAVVAVLVLSFTPAFSGHAIGSERWTALAVATDGLHMLGASGWVGAMAVLGAVLMIPRQTGNAPLVVALIAAFSPLALSAAATVTVSGVLSAALHLGSLEALTGSRYGRTLLVKVGMVLAVVLLGAFNWKRAGPRVMEQADERPMLTSVRAELAVSLLVLLATAALIVTPPPGEE